VCAAVSQVTPHVALMWRPDLKKYNVFLMSKTPEPAKPIKEDHIGLTFPLPTPISNAFQVIKTGMSTAPAASAAFIHNSAHVCTFANTPL